MYSFIKKIVVFLVVFFMSVSAEAVSPFPGNSLQFGMLDRIVFEQPDSEVVCENGLKIVFIEPIPGFDVDLDVKEPRDEYILEGNGYFGVSGVKIQLTNTTNDVMVVKWNQSQFRIDYSKGLPFLNGMRYMDAGNPSAIRDTIIAPGETVLEELYSSNVHFDSGSWQTYVVHLAPSWTTNAGVYMKVEKNGSSNYVGKTSPNIIIK